MMGLFECGKENKVQEKTLKNF